jgi:hypothetical protein
VTSGVPGYKLSDDIGLETKCLVVLRGCSGSMRRVEPLGGWDGISNTILGFIKAVERMPMSVDAKPVLTGSIL